MACLPQVGFGIVNPNMDPRHVISTAQFFDRPILEKLFAEAAALKKKKTEDVLRGKILAALFYEPSTRTRFSFEAAMLRLGGGVISSEAAGAFSSAMKGESLEDSIKTINGYADVIVLRHPEVGAAERASSVSDVPVVNAGDGGGEHPTQALLDIFTINEELGKVDGAKIVLAGDLLNGRTVHSLTFLLGLYKDVELYLVSPDKLQLPQKYIDYLKQKQIPYHEVSNFDFLDDSIDVVYMTRVQKERFADPEEYEKLKHYFIFGADQLGKLSKKAVIMHPLPRVGEIDPVIDSDPRAAYFRQAHNGLYVRMALLKHILDRST